jgi:hypothetical protein
MSTIANGNGAAANHLNGVGGSGATLNISAEDRAWMTELVSNQYLFRNDFLGRIFSSGTDDRIYQECGYPYTASLSPEYYRDLYDRDPIANRVVQLMPKETMQGQPTVYEDTAAEVSTPFEEDWDNLSRTLSPCPSFYQDEQGSLVWEYMLRADILSGIGQFGLILLGIDDGRNLQDPADGVEVLTMNSNTGAVCLMPDSPADANEEQQYRSSYDQKHIDGQTFNHLMASASKSRERCLLFNAEIMAHISNKVTLPNGVPSTGAKFSQGEPGNGPFVQGSDQQYSGSWGLGLPPPSPRPADGDLSGTEQQYFGVQFGPSQYFGKPAKGRKLLFMRVYDESLVQVVRYEWNIRNPRFGMPVMYRITLNDPRQPHSGVGLPLATVYVHWSRVVHLADNLHSSEIFGVPRMQPVLNNILNLRKILSADGEGYWKSCINLISLETNPQLGGDVLIDKPGVRQMMLDVFSGLQRYMLLRGMSAKSIAPTLTDPQTHVAVQYEAICIKLGCPVRVFKGSERGELASSQDDEDWNERRRGRQICYNTPRLVTPVVDRLIQLGVLRKPTVGKDKEKPNVKVKPPAGGMGKGAGAAPPAPKPGSPQPGKSFETNQGRMTYEVNPRNPRQLIIVNQNGKQTGAVTASGYSILWPDMDALGDKDKAAIALQQTQTLAAYIAGSCDQLIPPSDFLTKVMHLEDEDVQQMLEDAETLADDQQQQAADAAAVGGFEASPPPGFQKPEPPEEDEDESEEPGEGDGEEGKEPSPVVLKPGEKLVHGQTGKQLAAGNRMPKKPPARNAFCPTGPGGGQDNTCSPHGQGGAATAAPVKGSGTREDPWQCGSDIKFAAQALFRGEHIKLDQPEQVSTLLKKFNKLVKSATELGANAPDIDLCKVSVPNTNLFCQESMGIPRAQMPQMRGLPKEGSYAATLPRGKKSGKVDLTQDFLDHLQSQGIGVKETAIKSSHLRASQGQIVGSRVAQLMNETKAGTRDLREKPIWVTKDNYILDGHHHWAADVGMRLGKKDWKIPVYKVDLDIGTAITMANDFTREKGLLPKSGATAPTATHEKQTVNAMRTHHQIKRDLIDAGNQLSKSPLCMKGYGAIDMKNDGSGHVWYTGGDSDGQGFRELVLRTLKAIDGVRKVTYRAEVPPPREAEVLGSGAPLWDEVWINDGSDYSHEPMAEHTMNKDDDDIQWITVSGHHIPIHPGKGSVKEQLKAHFDQFKKSEGGRGSGTRRYGDVRATHDEDKGTIKLRGDARQRKAMGLKDFEKEADRLKGEKGAVILKTPKGTEHKIRNGDDLREFVKDGGKIPKGGGEHEHGEAGHREAAGGEHGGGHGGHGHEKGAAFEHVGHEVHASHEAHELAEVFGGHDEAHAAVESAHAAHAAETAGHAAHGAGEAAHAGGHGGHAAPTGLDAAAIIGRQLYSPMARAAAHLVAKVPGGKPIAQAITALHDGAHAILHKAHEGMKRRYGEATANAILGAGSVFAHRVMGTVGLHGPLASAIPAPHFIGAIPFVALAEAGKHLGVIGPGTKVDKKLEAAGTAIHAVREAIGSKFNAAAAWGHKAARVSGRLAGEMLRGGGPRQGAPAFALAAEGGLTLPPDEIQAKARELIHHLKSEYGKLVAQHKHALRGGKR